MGALVILFGTSQEVPLPYYLSGASALLATALYFRLLYFIALEFILIAGHLAIVFGSGPYTQFALPVLLCCQLLIFYLMYDKESNIFLVLGILGISLLSMSFAYNNQWTFLIGSTLIAIYAYHSARKGFYPAYIWVVLNVALASLSIYKLFA
jgi:hypothetical protein